MDFKRVSLVISVLLLFLGVGCGVSGVDAFSDILARDSAETTTSAAPQVQMTPAPLPTLLPSPTPVSAEVLNLVLAREQVLINLYQRVHPGVVSIEVTVNNGMPSDQQDDSPSPFNPDGQGAGFVYDLEGHIVTNDHVVGGSQAIEVIFYDGTRLSAEFIGSDPDSDLAVLKVDAPPEALLPLVWAEADDIQVGQTVVAIGNPFGLDGTLTVGVVSALGRSLRSLNPLFRIPEIIQTDAAINPGNSGGPLLNLQGEIVGVTNAIVPRQVGINERSFLGVGFAIPNSLARRVIPQLIEQGYYEHPFIGISSDTITPEIAEAMGLSSTKGVLVVEVRPNSPASRANLRGGTEEFVDRGGTVTMIGGDVIIAIEDEAIADFEDLISFLGRRGVVGETVTLTIVRDGDIQEIPLRFSARPR